MAQITDENDWKWLRKIDLKVGTEAIIYAAQEQPLSANYAKCNTDKTKYSPMYRLCGRFKSGECKSYCE